MTALMLAASNGHDSVVNLLIGHDAQVVNHHNKVHTDVR